MNTPTITARQFAFHSNVPSKAPTILNEYTISPIEYLKGVFGDGGYHGALQNLQSVGTMLWAGWSYDFKPFLKKYLYKQYGSWVECYAPNKTLLRKSVYGRIDQIVEI